ncbi:hypothetical protein PRIPAC_95804 [Pristionchus pacificus]|uniref:Uncharacterized protein n=1 Tax=Pristionchus pacificus TaxID=54126 RepID=A0A2A6BC86_PRIPA|nr:hypothetical protein PRIPAC_95804 [Pristionchus pacificus]|eukprot:PDM63451.1 hypothetical protein PRIPAC_53808 [Pristionchus pacificus]
MNQDQHKVLMVNELFEQVLDYTPLNSQLNLRASCKRLHDRVTERIVELQAPDECVIRKLTLSRLKNLLHIGVDVDQVATAQHFIELGQQAQKTWKRKNPKDMRCWFTFPVEGRRDFSFFRDAKIDHFMIEKRIPLHMEKENITWLKTLLMGSCIDKVSLVLDARTIPQMPKIPELLKIVHCTHVEFIIQSIHGSGKRNFSVQIRRLVTKLKEAGIEHVSITADRTYGDHAISRKEQSVDYDVILALVKGDILNVTFDCAFDGMLNERTQSYEKFKAKLAKTSKDVRIAFRGDRHIDHSWSGQRFRRSPDHPEYGVDLVDIVDSRRPEQELVFKKITQ